MLSIVVPVAIASTTVSWISDADTKNLIWLSEFQRLRYFEHDAALALFAFGQRLVVGGAGWEEELAWGGEEGDAGGGGGGRLLGGVHRQSCSWENGPWRVRLLLLWLPRRQTSRYQHTINLLLLNPTKCSSQVVTWVRWPPWSPPSPAWPSWELLPPLLSTPSCSNWSPSSSSSPTPSHLNHTQSTNNAAQALETYDQIFISMLWSM